jgi:glycosyltransferase involved in cell wall biosynthesis
MQFSYDAIIPFYNSENTILNSLHSVMNQTIKPSKIILVNDASTDKSMKIIESSEFEQHIHVEDLVDNVGAALARNIGASKGNSPFLIFFDADDVSKENRATEHSKYFEIGADICYVSSKKKYTNGTTRYAKNSEYFGKLEFRPLIELLLLGKEHPSGDLFIPAATLAVSRYAFENLSGFDDKLNRLEDVDLALRGAQKGLIFAFSKENQVIRSNSENNRKSQKFEYLSLSILLDKFKTSLTDIEYSKVIEWRDVQNYYFMGNYFKLVIEFLKFTFNHGLDTTKLRNGMKRVLLDFRSNQFRNNR